MATRFLILEHYVSGIGSTPDGDGTLYYQIYDNNGNPLQARTNTGITEFPTGSAIYRVAVPTWWAGVIVWDNSGDLPLASENFDPEPSACFAGPSALTITFTDKNNVPVPNVTFSVGAIGTAVTNGSGSVTLSLVDGTYDVLAVPTSGVLWSVTPVAVHGNTTAVIAGFSPVTPPVTPGLARGLKLRRSEMVPSQHWHIHGFRLKIEAVDPINGMDPNVFVFARADPDPITGTIYDRFLTVASFVDMSDYPIGDPGPALRLPYYRGSVIELDVRASEYVLEIWERVYLQVCRLCAAMDRAEVLTVTEEITCARDVETPVSDSIVGVSESI